MDEDRVMDLIESHKIFPNLGKFLGPSLHIPTPSPAHRLSVVTDLIEQQRILLCEHLVRAVPTISVPLPSSITFVEASCMVSR